MTGNLIEKNAAKIMYKVLGFILNKNFNVPF